MDVDIMSTFYQYVNHPYIHYATKDQASNKVQQSISHAEFMQQYDPGYKQEMYNYLYNHTFSETKMGDETFHLCDTRNKSWLKTILPALKESIFIAVGYSHLHGAEKKNGLVSLLSEKGFSVKPFILPRPEGNDEISIEELLQPTDSKNFDLELFDKNPEMGLYFACEIGDEKKVSHILKENKFQDNILIRAMALASINGKKEIAKTFFAVDPGFGQKALRYAAIAATYDKNEPLEAILKYTDITDLNFNLPSQDGSTPLWLLMLAFSQDKKQGLNYILDIKENKDIDLNFEINVEGYPNYKKLAQMINARGETRVLDSIIKKNAELNKSSGENIVDSSVKTTKFKR